MPISKAELKKKQALAQLVLEAKGVDMDDWLAEQFQTVVDENTEILGEAIRLYIDKDKSVNGKQPFQSQNVLQQ